MSRKHIKKINIKKNEEQLVKTEIKKEDKLHYVLEIQNCEVGQKGELK